MHSFLSAPAQHTAKARNYSITILLFRKMRLRDVQSLTSTAQPLRGPAGSASVSDSTPVLSLKTQMFSRLQHFLATKPLMCFPFDKLLLFPFHISSFTSEPETSLFRPNVSGLDATESWAVVCLPLLKPMTPPPMWTCVHLGVPNGAGEALSLTGFC